MVSSFAMGGLAAPQSMAAFRQVRYLERQVFSHTRRALGIHWYVIAVPDPCDPAALEELPVWLVSQMIHLLLARGTFTLSGLSEAQLYLAGPKNLVQRMLLKSLAYTV